MRDAAPKSDTARQLRYTNKEPLSLKLGWQNTARLRRLKMTPRMPNVGITPRYITCSVTVWHGMGSLLLPHAEGGSKANIVGELCLWQDGVKTCVFIILPHYMVLHIRKPRHVGREVVIHYGVDDHVHISSIGPANNPWKESIPKKSEDTCRSY